VQLPGLLLLVGIIGLAIVLWKRRGAAAVASFGIVWICLTLLPTSNFIIPAGIILAERTLFLPSVGALLALGAVVPWLSARLATVRRNDAARGLRVAANALVIAILTAGAWRSITRTPVWHDNERLFSQAVVDAPESYRAHYMLAAWMFDTKRKKEGEHHYRRALALFPYDPFMSYNLALQYQMSGMYAAAIPLYRWTFDLAPHFREGEGRENLAICFANMNQAAEAREQAFIAMQYGGARLKDLRRIVQFSDSVLGKPNTRARTKQPVLGKSDKVTIRKVLPESQIAGIGDLAKD
jgi:tetratricopeptide (TPR) repeat protein